MLKLLQSGRQSVPVRTYKNFGHGREKTSSITTLWHGFLTFTFIGTLIEWKQIGRIMGIISLPETDVNAEESE